MTVMDVAKPFVALLKEGKHHEAGERFNAEDIVSLEAGGPMAETRGKAAVKAKGEWWVANHEVHGGTVEGPYPNGNQFAVRFNFDVTVKASGQRIQMDEIALYTVQAGKIVVRSGSSTRWGDGARRQGTLSRNIRERGLPRATPYLQLTPSPPPALPSRR